MFIHQIQKKLLEDERLKLTASVRYDKSELFDGFVSPRLSVGYTAGADKNHNIRASVQTGFRNPTTQDLYIGLRCRCDILVGSAPDNLERYSRPYDVSLAGQQLGNPASITQTGAAAYTNSFSAQSVQNFVASSNPADLVVETTSIVKPEKVSSFEVGYRGKLNRTIVDLSAYYNKYQDFLSNGQVISPLYGVAGDNSLSIAALANSDFVTYQTYTNSEVDVNSYGASIGISTKVLGGFDLGGIIPIQLKILTKKQILISNKL